MRRFYLLVKESENAAPRRVDIDAADRDGALYLAESYGGSGDLELWEGESLVAEMSSAAPHLWMLRPICGQEGSAVHIERKEAGTPGDRIAGG